MQLAQIGVIVVLLLAWAAISWRGRRALDELGRGITALDEGRRTWPNRIRTGGAVGRLTALFDAVAPRLEARIERLEQERRQLRAVLSGMAEGVIAIDPRRRLVFANASADKFFGLDASAVGRLVAELVRSPQVQEAVEATLTGTGPYEGEINLPSREPGLRVPSRILAVHGTPLTGSPPQGAVLVFHDVTELRRLERMRQDFVANASHELKTPLASIKAYTETLLDWALHDENVNEKFLHRIEEQADRLNQLILDLLSLARLESGQDFYEHGPLALVPFIESCVESHRGRAEAKNLNLTVNLSPIGNDTLILADEEAIRQILDNLIDNAIKYTPEGGTVRVRGQLLDNCVAFDVTDTGIGIPRDDLPRIFERFYRADKARSRELGGTGLGLSIVKHLVLSLGGKISVDSRVGSGTRFMVKLPQFQPPLQKS